MLKNYTFIQTIGFSAVFSAISGWYGFMFGRESARKELGHHIENLRSSKSDPDPSSPSPSPPQ